MTPSLSPPPAAAAPPGAPAPPGTAAPPGNAPPGEGTSPPAAPFASVLNEQVARTAVAEGQPKTATDSGGHRETRGGERTDQNDLAQTGAQDGKSSGSLLASFEAVAAPAPAAQAPAPGTAAPAGPHDPQPEPPVV